ncbi:MAG: NAD-dependent deacylase [Bacteroidia bacterium]|nr:NAD-dependent deacylase [Bacteroidia bacterium]
MKKLVVLTGAGISAESGIKTFRDMGGLWEEYDIEEVASPQGWENNMELVLDFYNQRRKQLLECKPNQAHYKLAELEKDFDVQIITQNVDDLHERAGSKNILHLHGELNKSMSTGDTSLVYKMDGWELKKGDVCEKGFQLRPFIVWFGEAVPMMEQAIRITEKADILAVVGTSLNVYPAAGLLNYVKPNIPVFLIDPNDVNCYRKVTVIKEKASTGITRLAEILKTQNF